MGHKDWLEPEMEIEDEISSYSSAWGDLPSRLGDLRKEMDIETLLLVSGAVLTLIGLGLGTKRRRWLLLPAGVALVMFRQATKRDSALVNFFRRWGFRTQQEITEEMLNLKKSDWGVGELSAATGDVERSMEGTSTLEPPPL